MCPIIAKRPKAGFSLLDLLLGISITAALLSAALLQMPKVTGSYVLRREAKVLERSLNVLMLSAQRREEDLMLRFDHRGYAASPVGQPGAFMLFHDIPSSMSIKIITSAGHMEDRLFFFSGGTASPSSIRLEHKARNCLITLSLRGRTSSSC